MIRNRWKYLFLALVFMHVFSCSPKPNQTSVTFKINNSSGEKIAVKAGDIHGLYVVARNGTKRVVAKVKAGSSDITMELDNAAGWVFSILAFVEGNIDGGSSDGDEEEDHLDGALVVSPFPTLFYRGESSPVDLLGEPVSVSIAVEQVTELHSIIVQGQAINANNSTDRFDIFPDAHLVHKLTGYEYPVMLPSEGLGGVGYPNVLPAGDYLLVVKNGDVEVESRDITLTVTNSLNEPLVIDDIVVHFVPTIVHDETELRAAIVAANQKAGFDVINIVGGGASPNSIVLNQVLPSLTDHAGVAIRAVSGNVEILGTILSAPQDSGLIIESSRNIVDGVDFRFFPGAGILFAIQAQEIPPAFNQVLNCEITNNLRGGILAIGALLTILGPNNQILDNEDYGIYFDGSSRYALIFGSKISGPLSPIDPGKVTSCIRIEGDSRSIGVGDYDSSSTNPFALGNTITSCVIGVEIGANADNIDVDGNIFGYDASVTSYLSNKAAIVAVNSGSLRANYNKFICNGEILPVDCSPASTPPASLPTEYSPGGGVVFSNNTNSVNLFGNQFVANAQGIYVLQDFIGSSHIINNTIFANEVGINIGNNSSVDFGNNIVSHNQCVSSCYGVMFGNNSSFRVHFSNLFFNFDSSFDVDCTHPNPTYCSSEIKSNINGNLTCNSGSQNQCDPRYIDELVGTFDLALKTASPAVDKATLVPELDDVLILGGAPDMGAVESH